MESIDILRHFLRISSLGKWKIARVHAFAEEEYEQIFNNIRWNEDEEADQVIHCEQLNSMLAVSWHFLFSQHVYVIWRYYLPKTNAFLNLETGDDLLDGMILRGLVLLQTVSQIKDREELASTMEYLFGYANDDTLECLVCEMTQERRRHEQ